MRIESVFYDWTECKVRCHLKNSKRDIYFRKREIWWAALGQNIGHEVNGKNSAYERPVLIIKKYSGSMLFVLPISTQINSGMPWYQVCISVPKGQRSINISQGRVISSRRLLRKMCVRSHFLSKSCK